MTTSSFISAIEAGTAQVLTVAAAQSLIGKKIAWMYFGYNAPEVKVCTVGRIVSEWEYYSHQPMEGYSSRAAYWETHMQPSRIEVSKNRMMILDDQDEMTYMYSDSKYFDEATFVCSDDDREVYFIVLEDEPEQVVPDMPNLAGKTALISSDFWERWIYEICDDLSEAKALFSEMEKSMLANRGIKEIPESSVGGEIFLVEFPDDTIVYTMDDFAKLDKDQQEDLIETYDHAYVRLNQTDYQVFYPENLFVKGYYISILREELSYVGRD